MPSQQNARGAAAGRENQATAGNPKLEALAPASDGDYTGPLFP